MKKKKKPRAYAPLLPDPDPVVSTTEYTGIQPALPPEDLTEEGSKNSGGNRSLE